MPEMESDSEMDRARCWLELEVTPRDEARVDGVETEFEGGP